MVGGKWKGNFPYLEFRSKMNSATNIEEIQAHSGVKNNRIVRLYFVYVRRNITAFRAPIFTTLIYTLQCKARIIPRFFFYVLLTVYLSIILDNYQLDSHLLYFNSVHVSIIICSSSGG